MSDVTETPQDDLTLAIRGSERVAATLAEQQASLAVGKSWTALPTVDQVAGCATVERAQRAANEVAQRLAKLKPT